MRNVVLFLENLCAYDCYVNIIWFDCTCMHRDGRPLGAYDLGVATPRALVYADVMTSGDARSCLRMDVLRFVWTPAWAFGSVSDYVLCSCWDFTQVCCDITRAYPSRSEMPSLVPLPKRTPCASVSKWPLGAYDLGVATPRALVYADVMTSGDARSW
nr:hypothetical protein [Tanacetum cinerariifolium]